MIVSHTWVLVWFGRALSTIVVIALSVDAASILLLKAKTRAELAATGFAESAGPAIGIIAILCAVLYAVPQTAVLGAILLTGFLGGAICTHFRLGKIASPPQMISLGLGVVAWGGLYFRDALLQQLLPWSG